MQGVSSEAFKQAFERTLNARLEAERAVEEQRAKARGQLAPLGSSCRGSWRIGGHALTCVFSRAQDAETLRQEQLKEERRTRAALREAARVCAFRSHQPPPRPRNIKYNNFVLPFAGGRLSGWVAEARLNAHTPTPPQAEAEAAAKSRPQAKPLAAPDFLAVGKAGRAWRAAHQDGGKAS